MLLWELHTVQAEAEAGADSASSSASVRSRHGGSASVAGSVPPGGSVRSGGAASTALTTWRPLAPAGGASAAPRKGIFCEGDEALPHLPVAVLAALPLPAGVDTNAMMNLYWMYKRRADALLADVFALQADVRGRSGGGGAAPLAQHVQAAIAAAFKAAPWMHTAAGGEDSAAHLEAHWLAEVSAYKKEAAAWLQSAVEAGHRQAISVQRTLRANRHRAL